MNAVDLVRVPVVRVVDMFVRVLHRLVRVCSLGHITRALFEEGVRYRRTS